MMMIMVMDYMRMDAYCLQSNRPYHPSAYLYLSICIYIYLYLYMYLDGSLQMMSLGDPNLVLNYCRYGVLLILQQ